jgi:hypothetical protein
MYMWQIIITDQLFSGSYVPVPTSLRSCSHESAFPFPRVCVPVPMTTGISFLFPRVNRLGTSGQLYILFPFPSDVFLFPRKHRFFERTPIDQ